MSGGMNNMKVPIERWCRAVCSHGGICEREKGHEGLHDTGRCEPYGEAAMTDAEGEVMYNKRLREKGPPFSFLAGE